MPYSRSRLTVEHRLAYLAGALDARGGVRVTRQEIVDITICSVERDYLDHLRMLTGCGCVGLHLKPEESLSTKALWHLQIRGRDAEELLYSILPYMHRKADKIARILELDGVPC